MASISRALQRWHDAGLLDAAARDRILTWELSQARPVWLWAVAGVGGFAVALGVAALVAANWDAIPAGLKVGVHLVLDAAVAGALFVAWRSGWNRARELLALVLFGLVLSGIGLVGQVYQLGGTAWQGLLAWMLVCTPFLALLTRSSLLAVAWSLGAATTYAAAVPGLAAALGRPARWDLPDMALLWVFPAALLAAGMLRGVQPGAQAQSGGIKGVACLLLLAAASWPSLLLSLNEGRSSMTWGIYGSLALTILLLGPPLAFDRWRTGRWNQALVALPAAGWLAWWLTVPGRGDAAQLGRALVFIAFWAVVAWFVLRSGRRGAFTAAFAVIGLRVFVFYWEVFGSLLSTGLGLIGGGVLCLALAALGWTLVKRTAPAVAP